MQELVQRSPNVLYLGDEVLPQGSRAPGKIVAFGPKGAERVKVEFDFGHGIPPLRRWYDWDQVSRA